MSIIVEGFEQAANLLYERQQEMDRMTKLAQEAKQAEEEQWSMTDVMDALGEHRDFRAVWEQWFSTPSLEHSAMFCIEELAEYNNAAALNVGAYNRNRGGVHKAKRNEAGKELADLFLMLDTVLLNIGFDHGQAINALAHALKNEVPENPGPNELVKAVCDVGYHVYDEKCDARSIIIKALRAMATILSMEEFHPSFCYAVLGKWELRAKARQVLETVEELREKGLNITVEVNGV